MSLTALLLALKFLSVYIEPRDPLNDGDQRVATCVVDALTARPSALVLAPTKEGADVVLTVENGAAVRMHVKGVLVAADGRLLADVDHVQLGWNHKLCHQTNGMIKKLTKQLAKANRPS